MLGKSSQQQQPPPIVSMPITSPPVIKDVFSEAITLPKNNPTSS